VEAPQAYKNAGIANLISGAISLLVGLIGVISTLCMGVNFLLGAALGGFAAYVGWQMYQGQVSPQAKVGSIIGIVAGIANCNIFSIGLSIFALMQMQDDQVAGWLEQNGVA